MRVKRFVSTNIQDAMLQVKMEMGKDAVILHTRKFKEGGILGFFSREKVEITAAIDENLKEEKPKERKDQQFIWPETVEAKKDDSNKNRNEIIKETNELDDMKKLMQEMKEQIEHAGFNIGLNKVEEKIYQKLIENEVDEKLAKRIIKKSLDNIPVNNFNAEEIIEEKIIENISRILRKSKAIVVPKKRKMQVFALIGPTGVGKTTTIAKLAADFAINHKKKIALITADTYRIAAVEQLKTVGEIIGVPVDVVFTPQSMKNQIIRHSDKDLIFIDTAGRSHKNAMHMGELKGFLETAQPDEIFLVLSATTKYKDMVKIIENYENINYNKIIFTKLDETTTYGPILNIINSSKKYLSYLTIGQNVPDDIEIANPQKIAQFILKDGE